MTTYRRIKSVQLTIRIMKFLARNIEPIAGNVIATGLNEPVGTIMCHLSTLEDDGFVKRTGEHYSLGVYLATIRTSVRRSRELAIEQAQSDLDLIKAGGLKE